MRDLVVIFTLGNFTVTAYSLCLLLGAALGAALAVYLGRKKPRVTPMLSFLLAVIPSAWAGARIVYVLTQLESILVDAEYYGVPFILQPWQGGYTLYGAVLGGLLGGWAYARVTHRKAGELFDALVPGAALTLCCARLGEYFTSQGMGHYVEEEILQRFPFAVQGVYGDWQIPVFLYEALAALLIALALLLYTRRAPRQGAVGECFLVLLGATQILLESLREDECIRFGFVRFTQVAAIVVIAVVFFLRMRRLVQARGFHREAILRLAAFVLVIAVCILIEFALDKSAISNHLLYLVMAVALSVLGVAVLIPEKHMT